MTVDVETQYDKIYRYCYFRLHNRETAEDLTQEAFLRYFEKYDCHTAQQAEKCLYTIARNLCIDEYRKLQQSKDAWQELIGSSFCDETLQQYTGGEQFLTCLAVRDALSDLNKEEQELLLLRYVNEVPAAVIGRVLGISRFAVYRKLAAVSKKFKEHMIKQRHEQSQ